jgi:dTDP-4-dehydrorhamnose reductase
MQIYGRSFNAAVRRALSKKEAREGCASSSQVSEEVRALAPAKKVELVLATRPPFNLQDAPAITGIIRSGRRDAVINAAAYTDVDRAETAEGMAFAVNAQGPAQLATGPINAYGRTKLAGE